MRKAIAPVAIGRASLALCMGLALAAFSAAPSGRAADDYPQRAVKIIVPYPAGGSADYDFPLSFGGTFWMHSHQGL